MMLRSTLPIIPRLIYFVLYPTEDTTRRYLYTIAKIIKMTTKTHIYTIFSHTFAWHPRFRCPEELKIHKELHGEPIRNCNVLHTIHISST